MSGGGLSEEMHNVVVGMMAHADYCLIVYGSSAINANDGRDIDLLAVVDRGSGIAHHALSSLGSTKPCHLYVVPEAEFVADARCLTYGGYYAHKVALSFREISSSGRVIDPVRCFWSLARERAERAIGPWVSAWEIMRYVHADILSQRPTFLRALGKFARSAERLESLERWIAKVESVDVETVEPLSAEEYHLAAEKSLWRFWREYERHRGDGRSVWSDATCAKMRLSLDPVYIETVRLYLGEDEHGHAS